MAFIPSYRVCVWVSGGSGESMRLFFPAYLQFNHWKLCAKLTFCMPFEVFPAGTAPLRSKFLFPALFFPALSSPFSHHIFSTFSCYCNASQSIDKNIIPHTLSTHRQQCDCRVFLPLLWISNAAGISFVPYTFIRNIFRSLFRMRQIYKWKSVHSKRTAKINRIWIYWHSKFRCDMTSSLMLDCMAHCCTINVLKELTGKAFFVSCLAFEQDAFSLLASVSLRVFCQ